MAIANKKKRIERIVRAEASRAKQMALRIHELAEPAFKEVESSRLIADYLAEHGFRVDFCFRTMPTAFRAVAGRGKPTIGMLGEYDALPNCGPREGDWGHGCGHDLLGVASAVGAVAATRILQASGRVPRPNSFGRAAGRAATRAPAPTNKFVGGTRRKRAGSPGRIVYYGCPAEETLAGKPYMARDGAFRELDACLCWHPGADTNVDNAGGSAMDSLVFEFFGQTAHGASAEGGRSALDAAVLFDVAVNYLREHVPENVRIHSVIRDGGDAPNVVPAYAKSWYYIRGKDREQVDHVRERLVGCAKGAATATETRIKWSRIAAIYSRLPNDALWNATYRNLKLFGPPKATAADKRRARDLGAKGEFSGTISKGRCSPGRASSDQDTVSWLAPLGHFGVTTTATGVRGHHRDYAAHMALPLACRGMLQAAKVLAGTAVDLCADAALMRKIRAEFNKRTRDFTFDPLISKRQRVPIDPP